MHGASTTDPSSSQPVLLNPAAHWSVVHLLQVVGVERYVSLGHSMHELLVVLKWVLLLHVKLQLPSMYVKAPTVGWLVHSLHSESAVLVQSVACFPGMQAGLEHVLHVLLLLSLYLAAPPRKKNPSLHVKLHPKVQLKVPGGGLSVSGHGAHTESDICPAPHTVLYVPAVHWDVLHAEQPVVDDL